MLEAMALRIWTILNIPMIDYYDFAMDDVCAFTTTRHGGYSKGNYGELNINPHRGDNPSDVERNFNLVAAELGLNETSIIRLHQVHKTEIRVVDDAFMKLPQEERNEREGIDGAVTNLPLTCVGVFTADCIPVLFYDSVNSVVAAAHAGWRGTVQRIARKMVRLMRDGYGCEPGNIRVLVGPGITRKNFEVGQEVYDTFAEAGFDMDKIACKYPVANPDGNSPEEKWHIDLPECNRLQLIAEGLLPQNIVMTGIDTFDNPDKYFSARRLKVGFGTMYTGVFLL